MYQQRWAQRAAVPLTVSMKLDRYARNRCVEQHDHDYGNDDDDDDDGDDNNEHHHQGAWLHVDASYAGSALICPEFRHLMNGVR